MVLETGKLTWSFMSYTSIVPYINMFQWTIQLPVIVSPRTSLRMTPLQLWTHLIQVRSIKNVNMQKETSHFSCLGPLNGLKIKHFYVCFLTGQNESSKWNWYLCCTYDNETRIIEEGSKNEFLRITFNKNNLLPGRPSCHFEGNELPCFGDSSKWKREVK